MKVEEVKILESPNVNETIFPYKRIDFIRREENRAIGRTIK